MNCDTAAALLVALFEDGVPAPEQAALQEHLALCPECTVRRRRLQALRDVARALPREVPTSADLWPRVRTRIQLAGHERSDPPAITFAQAAALTLALGVGALLATRGAMRHVPRSDPDAAARPITTAEGIRASFAPSRKVLLKVLGVEAQDLALRPALAAFESAIGRTHAALSGSPDGAPEDPKLLLQLARTYREEMRLLRRMAEARPPEPRSQPSATDPAS